MPFVRVNKENRCPICDAPDWCMVTVDGEKAICPRTMEGSIRHIDGSGYLHEVRKDRQYRPDKILREKRYHIDAERIARDCHELMDHRRLAELAYDLNVSTASLESLMVGWHEPYQAYTFPMRDGMGNIIGIRTRHADGSKRCVTGSKSGLFTPDQLPRGSIYICEGPTDVAAMLTLGLAAIGRPSCMGSHDQVRQFLNNYRRDVIVIADNDGPGREGAARLCEALGVGRIVEPPENVKDIRERVKEVIRDLDMEVSHVGTHSENQ